ncbi:MAG: hypothetical protein IPG58_08185 [Acidobacteria bacterium]|nr:hypothetical protein [Acidobacteriota bacterium]
MTDPDVVQGRKPMEPVAPGGGGGGGFGGGQQPQPPISSQPRVVLRFAPERDLLVSGMMAGGAELAGKAAVVDVPVGKGHVVMFANNPMWRHQTHGSSRCSLTRSCTTTISVSAERRRAARPQVTKRYLKTSRPLFDGTERLCFDGPFVFAG